jgi:calcineurin-like phosphoesterase family protein
MSFNFGKYVREHGPLWTKRDGCEHVFVAGNHDDFAGHKKLAYLSHFPIIVGLPKEWKKNVCRLTDLLDGVMTTVLVSHAPLETVPDGWVNVHGHIHNNALQAPDNKESGWTLKSPVHFNAGVELHGYKPVSLQSLADEHRRGYSNSRASALGTGEEFEVAPGV